MKTPKEIISWCEMMLKRNPNVEDANYFRSIISAMNKLSYITERPCDVCKFNENGSGCKKWTCVFEDDGKENVNEMQGL